MSEKKLQRARILAPKVTEGKPFEVISEFWFTTFPELNPFIGRPFCRHCKMPAVFHRSIGILHGGAVTIEEFACIAGHVWRYEQVHD